MTPGLEHYLERLTDDELDQAIVSYALQLPENASALPVASVRGASRKKLLAAAHEKAPGADPHTWPLPVLSLCPDLRPRDLDAYTHVAAQSLATGDELVAEAMRRQTRRDARHAIARVDAALREGGVDVPEARAALDHAVALLSSEAGPAPSCGRWLESWADDGDPLARRPAPQPCVLRISDGSAAGVPYLPQGKLAMLAGAGGANKSRLTLYWCVAVATGRRLFGELYCPTPGPVALVSGEDEQDEIHRRLEAVAAALELSREERRAVARNLWISTVDDEDDDDSIDVGTSVLVTSADRRTLMPSPYALKLRRELTAAAEERGGFRLVVVDPLVAFSPAEAEIDNSAAFRTMRAFRRFTRLPGSPSVLLVHHSTKGGRVEGGVNSVRGSGALTDNARWVAVMTARKNVKRIETVKSNTTAPHVLYVEQTQPRGDLVASTADAWDALEEKPTKKTASGEWGG